MEFENKKLRSVAEAAARIMMGEKALHPNQQKLDVHEPEKDKLTSHDFKKLRTMKKEETMHEESCECGSCPSDKDMKKEEVDLEEARSTNLHAGGVGNEVHMSKWMQDHTKKNKSTGTPDSWNEYHGKGTVTHLGKDGHVKVKSHDTGKTHKFSYYGKGIGPDSEDMSVHKSKDDIHSLRNVKEEVDLDEGKMGQLSADLKDLSHDDFHKEYGKPKSHYDPSNFKKPVQKGKEMDRAKSLAQRAMASMKKEEVEELEETLDKDGNPIPVTKGHFADKKYTSKGLPKPYPALKNISTGKVRSHPSDKNLAKEEVEEIEEMFPGTPEYEKKYGKAPQDMKKGEKKKTTQGEMEKTGKGVVHRRKFSEMVESYTEGGVKGLFKTLAEEPTSAEFDAQLDDAKKRAAGTKKQAEVSKPAVQAVQNEEVELTLEDFTPEELEDFMQTEEYEQLDELSKETYSNYINKSKKEVSLANRNSNGGRGGNPRLHDMANAGRISNETQNRVANMHKGVKHAKSRLAAEAVESFEEQTHTTVEFIDYNDVNGVKYAEIDLEERKMSEPEMEKKEEIVKGMKKGLAGFKERYGKDAKSVMYATATARAKGE
jgi:hypothetical protein